MELTNDERRKRIEDWDWSEDCREWLSQEEIDALMRTLDVENDSARWAEKPYWFDRPAVLTKRQTRALGIMAEKACRLLTKHFAAATKQLCHFHVASMDEITYEEFTRSLPVPTLALSAQWGGEHIALQLDNEIAAHLMYGSLMYDLSLYYNELEEEAQEGLSVAIAQIGRRGSYREFSDTELEFLRESTVKPILHILRSVFGKARELPKPGGLNMQTNPFFVDEIEDREMVVLITLQAKVGDEEGMLNLCLPKSFVQNVLVALGVLQKDVRVEKSAGGAGLVSLGAFAIPEGAKATVGSLIALNRAAGNTVDLYDTRSGAVFARGEVVTVGGELCVRVTEVPPKDGA